MFLGYVLWFGGLCNNNDSLWYVVVCLVKLL